MDGLFYLGSKLIANNLDETVIISHKEKTRKEQVIKTFLNRELVFKFKKIIDIKIGDKIQVVNNRNLWEVYRVEERIKNNKPVQTIAWVKKAQRKFLNSCI